MMRGGYKQPFLVACVLVLTQQIDAVIKEEPNEGNFPKSCKEVYAQGNTEPGFYTLQTQKGTKHEVYCVFIDEEAGFMFPGRNAIENIPVHELNIETVAPGSASVMILQRRADGSTHQALVKPLEHLSKFGMTFKQNGYKDFAKPYRLSNFGDKFIYFGLLNIANYGLHRSELYGFQSNRKPMQYRDCDKNPNNYFVFFSNLANKTLCENLGGVIRNFMGSFETSTYAEVMDNKDFWYTLEIHMGGCGGRYASACSTLDGYAIGIPYGDFGGVGAQCHCSGDPHCMSFDGKKLDYYGACRYTAVQDGCVDGIYRGDSTFKVVLDFHKMIPRYGVTWTKSVHVEIAGHGTVSLLENNKAAVNGLSIDSFPASPFTGVVLRKSHDTVSVTLKNRVEVTWSQRRWLFTVYVPGKLQGKVCGMCGNFNGNAEDDWMMGDGWKCPAMAAPGEVTDNANKFGGSWLAGLDTDEGCTKPKCDEMNVPAPECKPADEEKAKIHCHELFNTNGRFKTCLDKISKEDLDNFVHDCEFDTCMVGDPDNELLCNQAENLVELCQIRYDVKVTGWRDSNFCAIECPENMVYKDCGSIFQPSCSDRKGSTGDQCKGGCFCASGFVADGDKCILPEECGCTMNGVMYQLGTTILTSDCSRKCTCTKGDEQMVCAPSECATNSMCTVQNYERVCVCPPTHVGSGKVCFPKEATCIGYGDPHYITFDNKRFDFMGTCQYVMARDGCRDGVPNSEPTFKLVADLYKMHPTHPVSYTKALYLYVKSPGEKKISLLRANEVKINAIRVNHFPTHLSSGVTINKEFDIITVTLPNKVIIKWNANKWMFWVTVTSDLLGETCGLCGNFNDDQDDDWTMGPATCERRDDIELGGMATSARIFGISWLDATDDDFTCSEECDHLDDPDPTCPLAEQATAKSHCSPLSDMNGIFKDCLVVMDIKDLQGLVSNCEFDTCIAEDDDNIILCGQAEQLVEVCSKKYGVHISDWRNINFCPLTCPPNMEFKDCGSSCPATCDDPDAPSTCVEPCREGCFCEEGYVADGVNCIKTEECGCVKDGVLYQVGESELNTDCSEQCTCTKANSPMECEPSGCHVNAVCGVIGGSRGCRCPDSYFGDGKTCELITLESLPDKKDFPCEASPAHCMVKRRSKCVAARRDQVCGVGVMTEIRHCYKDRHHTGKHTRHSVNRKCCIGRCDGVENTQGIPGGADDQVGIGEMNPGVGIVGPNGGVSPNATTGVNGSESLYVVRCKDVFPECEEP